MADIFVTGDNGTQAIIQTAQTADIRVEGALIGPRGETGPPGLRGPVGPSGVFVGPVAPSNDVVWLDPNDPNAASIAEVFIGPEAPPSTLDLWVDTDDLNGSPVGGSVFIGNDAPLNTDDIWVDPDDTGGPASSEVYIGTDPPLNTNDLWVDTDDDNGTPTGPGGSGSLPWTSLGDILYLDATPAPARLGGNTSATKKFLSQTGNGSASAAPVWAGLVAGDIPNIAESQVTGLAADLAALTSGVAAKAADTAVVHNTGAETVAGVKTFSSAPVVPTGAFPESAVANLTTDLAAKATDSLVLHLAGAETVSGAKKFAGNVGFFNTTPIAQPTGNIGAALVALGLITTPTIAEADITNLVIDLAAKVAKDSQVYNAKDHGVAGDNTTDDGAAINTFFATLTSGGVTVFPPGTYLTTVDLTPLDKTVVLGCGDATVFKAKTGTTNVANVFKASGKTGIQFERFAIDGNKANINQTGPGATYTQKQAIYVTGGSTHISVRDLYVHDTFAGGVVFDDASVFIVSGNRFKSCGDNAIFCRPAPATPWTAPSNFTISSNIVSNGTYSGIGIIKANNFVLMANESYSNAPLGGTSGQGSGISLEGCTNFTCKGNQVHDNGVNGIDVRYSDEGDPTANIAAAHGTISGNQCYNNGYGSGNGNAGGIIAEGADDIMIQGNNCYHNDNGINIGAGNGLDPTHILVQGNQCRSNAVLGLKFYTNAAAVDLVAEGNYIEGNGSDQVTANCKVTIKGGKICRPITSGKECVHLLAGASNSLIMNVHFTDPIDNCVLVDNTVVGTLIRDCVFDKGSGSGGRGLYEANTTGAATVIENCKFIGFTFQDWAFNNTASYATRCDGSTTGGAQTQKTLFNAGPIELSRAAGNNRSFILESSNSYRWEFGAGNGAESGSNAGSDFFFNTYDDSGNYLGTPISIARATGLIALNGGLSVGDGKDVPLGTGTGTKFGTATTQKMAFYGSTPIVQPTGGVAKAMSDLGLVGTVDQPNWAAAEQGLLAWNFDIVNAGSTGAALATAGTLYVQKLKLPRAMSVTNILIHIGTQGGTLTTGQCFAAIYQGVGGSRLGVTADQASAWGSSGLKTMAISGGPINVAAGDVYVALWFNGTTGPALKRGASGATQVNLGLAAAASRFGTADTGRTTTGPTTLGTISQAAESYWVGLS